MAADNRDFVNKFANEGGGDVYAEDKRFEELKSATAKTGSQISTLAQYIPLQDTDGNLVKINPQSFQEAVRNVLGSLLANNDKGTTISGIPALSGSGASLDFGSISPANLASVLGAIGKQKTMPTDTDCNTLLDTGIYFFSTSGHTSAEAMHKPTANNCCVLVIAAYITIQFHLDQHGDVHLRSKDYAGTWSSWAQLI